MVQIKAGGGTNIFWNNTFSDGVNKETTTYIWLVTILTSNVYLTTYLDHTLQFVLLFY